jgi:hypothetical protein
LLFVVLDSLTVVKLPKSGGETEESFRASALFAELSVEELSSPLSSIKTSHEQSVRQVPPWQFLMPEKLFLVPYNNRIHYD